MGTAGMNTDGDFFPGGTSVGTLEVVSTASRRVFTEDLTQRSRFRKLSAIGVISSGRERA
jgi:hypothetical protein